MTAAFDLCDDAQAVDAGFDAASLVEDRDSMGVVCSDPQSDVRYLAVTPSGMQVFGRSPEHALAQAAKLERVAPGQTAKPFQTLGAFGALDSIDTHSNAVEVVPKSVMVSEGVVRGLVRNMSTSMYARAVFVKNRSGPAVPIPMTIQPGEAMPFEIPFDASAEEVIADVTVSAARLTPAPALERAVLLDGAPGYWSGEASNFAGILPHDHLPSGPFSYFETGLSVAVPTGHELHPSAGKPIRNVKVVGFCRNLEGGVIHVSESSMYEPNWGGEHYRKSDLGQEMLLTGFVLPADCATFHVVAGGDK